MALPGMAQKEPVQEAVEQQTLEAVRPERLRTDRGPFAVVCGGQLLGIFESVDEALSASARAFEVGGLPEGAPVLISEIAERVSGRVMAHPLLHARGAAAGPLA